MTPKTSAPEAHPEETTLPPYLRDCPAEIDDLGLQVQLLTLELATHRIALTRLADMLAQMAAAIRPPSIEGAADG